MLCHECAMAGEHQPSVSVCRFCFIGLCKDHLVESFQMSAALPQYACHHRPAARAAQGADAGIRRVRVTA